MSLAGLEPATDGVETRRSVQLSYSDKVWSARVELNHRPASYKLAALTTELRAMELMVLAAGVEPAWVRLPFRQFRKLRGYASIVLSFDSALVGTFSVTIRANNIAFFGFIGNFPEFRCRCGHPGNVGPLLRPISMVEVHDIRRILFAAIRAWLVFLVVSKFSSQRPVPHVVLHCTSNLDILVLRVP